MGHDRTIGTNEHVDADLAIRFTQELLRLFAAERREVVHMLVAFPAVPHGLSTVHAFPRYSAGERNVDGVKLHTQPDGPPRDWIHDF